MSAKLNKLKREIYTIPAGISFTDALATGLLAQTNDNPEKLSSTLILLPTRRACRSLQAAFLKQSKGKPILLPRMQPFGDIDADELLISGRGLQNWDILPAMPPMKRQILLARLISQMPKFTKGTAQNMALAKALGQLMDQIYTENLSLANLPQLVESQDFADHWQITLKFLEILSHVWPQILQEQGCIDAADRRNKLIYALNDHWQNSPPDYPVIAAGTTGSIPATAALLQTISHLPQGSIILPGLDNYLPTEAWDAIEEGHPQATLKHLLNVLEYERQDVKEWPFVPREKQNNSITKEKLFSHVMAPACYTDQWARLHFTKEEKENLTTLLQSVTRYDCDTIQDEAQIITLLMREILEQPEKTAALITPDRNLARRVTQACQRWGITIDDSAGQTLSDTPIGQFIRLSAQALIEGIKPVSLLALLKHDFCRGDGFKNFRSTVHALDKQLLRGISPRTGFQGLRERYDKKTSQPKVDLKKYEKILDLINYLENIIEPALIVFQKNQNFKSFLKAHIELIETIASSSEKSSSDILWSGEAGESATIFLAEIYEHADSLPLITGHEYLEILEQFMASITVRPKYGTHPRLMILGQLEARLINADRVILGGLNEGIWPAAPETDPWMSRPMRRDFGLPMPQRSTTLSAHDFVQGVCCGEVFLTRSEKQDGTPMVPARWLERLDVFLQAIEINPDCLRGHRHKQYLEKLDEAPTVQPIGRPAPAPPIEVRPRELSVTKIEKWLQDPYSIYAEKILRLKKLDPIEKTFDAAERGNIIHKTLERFLELYPNKLSDSAANDFLGIGQKTLTDKGFDDFVFTSWKPRLQNIANWFITQEKIVRETILTSLSEAEGRIIIDSQTPFTLSARADRITRLKDGTSGIIDYKSGGNYSLTKMKSAELCQLPLEALILEQGGFTPEQQNISSIGYWVLTGAEKEPGKITSLSNEEDLKQSILLAKEGLVQLINNFDDPKTPYMAIPKPDNAPRYNDYAHLERIKEWAALGDDNDAAGDSI